MELLKYSIIFALVAWAGLTKTRAQANQVSTFGELQAAYLYNFAKYIKWPNSSNAFTIGVFGESAALDELKAVLAGKKVMMGEIKVKQINSMAEVAECQIIYLPFTNSRSINKIQTEIAGKPILLVTEEDLTRRGAAISFVVENDRLRFKLNKKSLEEALLVASEGLLKLAIVL